MKKEVELENSLKHKSFLILVKYIPHIIAINYAIYTMFLFFDIDLWWINYFVNISILPWLFMYLTSIIFRFCYVHRLPYYYIALCDGITVIDYYIGIPIEVYNLMLIHILLIIFLILGYSIYYIKYKL